MTVGVVDLLEVIEVEDNQRERVALTARAGEVALQCFIEIAAVEATGQAVSYCLLLQGDLQFFDFLQLMAQFVVGTAQLSLGPTALRNVTGNTHQGERLALGIKQKTPDNF